MGGLEDSDYSEKTRYLAFSLREILFIYLSSMCIVSSTVKHPKYLSQVG